MCEDVIEKPQHRASGSVLKAFSVPPGVMHGPRDLPGGASSIMGLVSYRVTIRTADCLQRVQDRPLVALLHLRMGAGSISMAAETHVSLATASV